MAWDVEGTDQFQEWYYGLEDHQQDAVSGAVDQLALDGPRLRRPRVGLIEASKHANMKELRISEGGALRVLFIFDPRRCAILLLGGNKTGQWTAWYEQAIPEADRLYDEYLADLKREGLL